MTNHPNRGWRSRWSVDLNSSTATHRDGWVFRFALADDDMLDGECIAQPEPFTAAHMAQVARLAREAGQIFQEVRNARH